MLRHSTFLSRSAGFGLFCLLVSWIDALIGSFCFVGLISVCCCSLLFFSSCCTFSLYLSFRVSVQSLVSGFLSVRAGLVLFIVPECPQLPLPHAHHHVTTCSLCWLLICIHLSNHYSQHTYASWCVLFFAGSWSSVVFGRLLLCFWFVFVCISWLFLCFIDRILTAACLPSV